MGATRLRSSSIDVMVVGVRGETMKEELQEHQYVRVPIPMQKNVTKSRNFCIQRSTKPFPRPNAA